MGLFGNSGGGIFGGLFDGLMNAVLGVFGGDSGMDEDEQLLYQEKFSQLTEQIETLKPFAKKADESYRILIYNNLNEVPAVELYDGDYDERLDELLALADGKTVASVENALNEVPQIATEIQTYLNEETSDLDRAKLWDSKFVKGINEHIPPHLKKGEEYDDTMAIVMEAFRNWASFGQVAIDMYGSQNLINATYEAVEEGQDAMDYMSEILNIDQVVNSRFGGEMFETTVVPYAGFFGGGFFL